MPSLHTLDFWYEKQFYAQPRDHIEFFTRCRFPALECLALRLPSLPKEISQMFDPFFGVHTHLRKVALKVHPSVHEILLPMIAFISVVDLD
jgi:hypothetical protein